jgi:hypothetical protein
VVKAKFFPVFYPRQGWAQGLKTFEDRIGLDEIKDRRIQDSRSLDCKIEGAQSIWQHEYGKESIAPPHLPFNRVD